MPSRTYHWQEADLSIDVMSSMSGRDYCDRLISGEHPASAVVEMIGIRLQQVSDGGAVATLEAADYLMHGRGYMAGGILSALLDATMAWAVMSILKPGSGFATSRLGVDFVRPVTSGTGLITAEARIITSSRRSVLAEVDARDGSGRMVAHATSSCAIFDVPKAGVGVETR